LARAVDDARSAVAVQRPAGNASRLLALHLCGITARDGVVNCSRRRHRWRRDEGVLIEPTGAAAYSAAQPLFDPARSVDVGIGHAGSHLDATETGLAGALGTEKRAGSRIGDG